MNDLVQQANDHVNAIKSIVGQLEEHIFLSSGNLKNAIARENDHTEHMREVMNAWEVTKKALEVEESDLQKRLQPLRNEEIRLNDEVAKLVDKKSDLKLENARLDAANSEFRTYESKAWKVLGAKDSELIARESALEQKEGLKPRPKTLLPSVD